MVALNTATCHNRIVTMLLDVLFIIHRLSSLATAAYERENIVSNDKQFNTVDCNLIQLQEIRQNTFHNLFSTNQNTTYLYIRLCQ